MCICHSQNRIKLFQRLTVNFPQSSSQMPWARALKFREKHFLVPLVSVFGTQALWNSNLDFQMERSDSGMLEKKASSLAKWECKRW